MIRATHLPAGARGNPKGPEPVRYAVQPAWPPAVHRRDARCQCTWVWRGGRMQLKYLNVMCPNRGATRA